MILFCVLTYINYKNKTNKKTLYSQVKGVFERRVKVELQEKDREKT